MEDDQDANRRQLTYFGAVSRSLPDLAPRPGAWQSSKMLSSSALLQTNCVFLMISHEVKWSFADDHRTMLVNSSE